MQAMNYVLRRLAKNVPNVTTDTTEQCLKVDLNSNYAGQCDTAIDSKDSNSSECETTCKVAYMSCDESECKEAAKEAITKAVIEGDCQIRNENEGCSEDSNLLKKASEIASFTKLHSDVMEQLTILCQLWEQKSPTLSIPEDRKEKKVNLHAYSPTIL